MKNIVILTLSFLLIINFTYIVNASEVDKDILNQQMEALDFEGIDNQIRQQGVGFDNNISFEDLVLKIISGEIDFSMGNLLVSFLYMLFGEIYQCGGLMRNLLVISILSALLKNLTESFKNKSVGELAFYISYVVLIMVLFTAFNTAVVVTRDLILSLSGLMESSIPLLTALVLMSGNVSSGFTFSPLFIIVINIISIFIKSFLAPFIILAAAMQIVNYLTEKEILNNFSNLLKSICIWTLTGIAFLFVSVLSLQKVSAPILNNMVGKTAKATIGVIPIVGNVMNGAVEMVAFWAQGLKSGVMVGLIIVIALLCAFPVIKILALIFIFKLSAAIIQPISDQRIVKCIDAIGSFSLILLGCCVTVIVMFMLSVVIMLSF